MDKNISLQLSDNAKDWLAEHGYSSEYGARPLKRLLQGKIQDKIADGILSGHISEGASLIVNESLGEMTISEAPRRSNMH